MPQVSGDVAPSSQRGLRSERVRHWLRHVLGLDRAIAFTVLARGWSSMAGVVTVALIARFLSPAEQGYYYTFGSLVALQIVFELGFSFVILQMASHERAHLSFSADYVIEGDPIAHARLASVIQKSVRWYSIAAVLMAALLFSVGIHFFSTHQHAGQVVSWRLPWCFATIATTLTFQLDPILSFMEGCGFVSHVARLRFAQAAVGSVLAWLALITHHGLFAPSMMILGMASAAIVWLFGRRRLLLGLLRYQPGPNRVRWVKEVWPFQWRIAISWLSGYFIFQLFNPVLFAFKGPVAAGQMGMSLSIATALQSIAISWINTKAAPFGTLIARKEYARLDQLFFQAIKQSVSVFVLGALIVWFGSMCMSWAHIRFGQRILDPTALGILLLATALNVVVFSEAIYLRAHKEEKLLPHSVMGAVLVGMSTYFLGKNFGATGMVIGYLLIALLMGLPASTYTFLKYRRAWHAA